jgi:hypothetical protein
MIDKQRMERAVAAMTESPLFYLFLASKELFHSNFLYWLSRQNGKELVGILCPEFESNGDLLILREKRVAFGENKAILDLYISNSRGHVVVVENKVKDYPDNEQLSRIANSLAGDTNILVLLSLLPVEKDAFPGWRILDYKTLSSRLQPGRFSQVRYHHDLIADYKDFTGNLSAFADTLATSHDYDFAIGHDEELFRNLNSYKLWEAYQKMRASHMVAVYRSQYGVDRVATSFSINHQKATIDFVVHLIPGKWLGISIENDQYRRYIHSETAQNDAIALLQNGLFFRRDFESPRKREPFLNYGTTCRYQYDRMQGPVSFDILFRSVNEDLQDGAISNLDQIRKLLS